MISVCVVVFVRGYIFSSLGCIIGSGTAWSYGGFIFKHLSKFQTVFKAAPFHILTSQEQGLPSIALRAGQPFLLFVFWL